MSVQYPTGVTTVDVSISTVISMSTSPTSNLAVPRLLASDLLPQRPASRMLGRHAAFCTASALLHSVVFLLADSPWSGTVSWRKPIVFSASFALMLWAFAWILDRLPDRPKMARRLAKTFAWSSAFELMLIITQAWRGRPSHFATEGADGVIFALMGSTVVVISVSLLVLLGWAIRRPPASTIERIAIFAGMAMIVSGLGIGQWIIELGNSYVDRFDAIPEQVINGEAGVAKFPHAIAFHGIQVFMVAAALLAQAGVSAGRAVRAMWTVAVAYTGVFVFSITQSFSGLAPFDIDVVSGGLVIVSSVVLAMSFVTMARWTRLAHPTPHEREATFAS